MITYGQLSDIGLTRKTNQDAVYSQVISGGGAFSHPDIGLFIVADGFGEEPDGRLVAEMIVTTITLLLSRILILPIVHKYMHIPLAEKLIEETLRSAFDEANKAIFARYQDGGAFATLTFVAGEKIYLAHVGSTAAFFVNQEKIERLTRFHDLAESMVERGEYSSREEFLKYLSLTNGVYTFWSIRDSIHYRFLYSTLETRNGSFTMFITRLQHSVRS